jgi:hypothetical protein
MLTTAGQAVLARMAAGQPAGLALGVGAGTAPATAGDLALAGEADSAAHYVPLDLGFPQYEQGGLVVQATFSPNAALFRWQEWGLAVTDGLISEAPVLHEIGEHPVLVSRHVPAVPLHSVPKDESRAWVLRAVLNFT